MKDNGTILMDPLDIEQIKIFFASVVMQHIQRGEACLLMVQDGDIQRPALITMHPDTVLMLARETKGIPKLESQTLGVHWYDTDPDEDFLEFPLVEIRNILAVMRIRIVDDTGIETVSKPVILKPLLFFNLN